MQFTATLPVSHAVRPMAATARAGVETVERQAEIFLAEREGQNGTRPISLLQKVARAASGWLSARVTGIFLAGRDGANGTRLQSAIQRPNVRSVPGWFPGRRSESFLADGKEVHGTLPLAAENRGVRAASGWLSARTPLLSSNPISSVTNASEPESSGDLPHYHLPVLPDEVSEWMAAGPGKFIIDGTLGGGGHSEAFLETGARVLGIDRDPEALAHARARLARFGDRFSTWESNFAEIEQAPEILRGERADGLLLDLGVSSRQLDAAERGFSFMREGPLDMRMGPSSPRTAADIVNRWDEKDISRMIFEFGEEPKARRIAAAIVERRSRKPFETTTDLASCIERAIGRQGRTHPATRAFQAIRMAVNEELESLGTALESSVRVLKPGGRLLVITFHSLEDRMVKRFLKYRSTAWLDEPGWPDPRPNPDCRFRLLVRKAVAPTDSEISRNPRARSSKLRVAELLAPL
jgi:16S rRNA (cytosine1402-N4)-methyltransferase